jgi:hypothetical protein
MAMPAQVTKGQSAMDLQLDFAAFMDGEKKELVDLGDLCPTIPYEVKHVNDAAGIRASS